MKLKKGLMPVDVDHFICLESKSSPNSIIRFSPYAYLEHFLRLTNGYVHKSKYSLKYFSEHFSQGQNP